MSFVNIAADPETADSMGASLGGLSGAWVGRGKKKRRCYSYKRRKFVAKRNCQPSRRTTKFHKKRGSRRVIGGAAVLSRRAHWANIKGVGRRCVKLLASGRRRIVKSSICGGTTKRGKKGQKRSAGSWGLPVWKKHGKAGRRCVVRNKKGGYALVKSSRCKGKRRAGLRGFEGFGFDLPTDLAGTSLSGTSAVAILANGDETEMATDLAGRRRGKSHCTAVKRGKGGYCACAKRAPGKAARGAFKAKCKAKKLTVRRAPRRGSFKGYEAADQEFLMGDQGLQGINATGQPRNCKRFTTIHSLALGRDIQVCAEVEDGPKDGSLGYYGGMGYGLGFDLMSVAKPAIGVAIGGGIAAALDRWGARIPGLNRIPLGGVVLAGLASLGAALFGPVRFRGQAAGAFTGVAAVAAYKLLKGEPMTGDAAVTGLGVIVPELGAIVPEMAGFRGAGGIDVLAGGDTYDDAVGGFGQTVDVLAGAFGSLPFAGAH